MVSVRPPAALPAVTLLAMALLTVTALSNAPQALAASLASNAGWLALIQAQHQPPSGRAWSEAFAWFYAPARHAPLNRAGQTGAGIFFALDGKYDLAQAAWRAAASDPAWLVNLGDQAEDAGSIPLAMRYYRGADELTNGAWPQAHIRVGKLCQMMLYRAEPQDEEQQAHCRSYFADGNLIVNGEYESGDLLAWVQHTRVGAEPIRYTLEPTDGATGMSLRLTSESDRQTGGLFQRIVLPPRTTVRFSARVRISPTADEASGSRAPFDVWVLNVGLVGRGDVQTITPPVVQETDGWQRVEHLFRTPARPAEGVYYLYPAVISGNGSVWIDDVHARIES